MELFHSIMFRSDNTEGYSESELGFLNDELATRIKYLANSDIESAYEIAKAFADEVSRGVRELMAQFEKEFSHRRLDREDKSRWVKGNIYQSGDTNDLFLAYRRGYVYGISIS